MLSAKESCRPADFVALTLVILMCSLPRALADAPVVSSRALAHPSWISYRHSIPSTAESFRAGRHVDAEEIVRVVRHEQPVAPVITRSSNWW